MESDGGAADLSYHKKTYDNHIEDRQEKDKNRLRVS